MTKPQLLVLGLAAGLLACTPLAPGGVTPGASPGTKGPARTAASASAGPRASASAGPQASTSAGPPASTGPATSPTATPATPGPITAAEAAPLVGFPWEAGDRDWDFAITYSDAEPPQATGSWYVTSTDATMAVVEARIKHAGLESVRTFEFPRAQFTAGGLPASLVRERVTVPAGTFDAVKVATEAGGRNVTYWYAHGVGLVRYVWVDATRGSQTGELLPAPGATPSPGPAVTAAAAQALIGFPYEPVGRLRQFEVEGTWKPRHYPPEVGKAEATMVVKKADPTQAEVEIKDIDEDGTTTLTTLTFDRAGLKAAGLPADLTRERVTVPAGTFDTVRVVTTPNGARFTAWYAQDVGLVQWEYFSETRTGAKVTRFAKLKAGAS